MLYSLLMSALLMGLAGLPHCSAMCAAPCAAVAPQGVSWRVLLGRTLGYALLGALAAGVASALAGWARWSMAFQPLWVMVLAAAVLLGGALMLTGQMPQLVQLHGQRAYEGLRQFVTSSALATRWPRLAGALPVLFGAAWAALPCGLIYAAVTVATLAPTVWGGALVMAVFSLPGAVALWWLPRQFAALRASAPRPPLSAATARAGPPAGGAAPVFWMAAEPTEALSINQALPSSGLARGESWLARLQDPRWALRLSGAMLAGAASWALVHRLSEQWQAWCA